MDSTKTIDHLPDEILVNIFSYLKFDSLFHSVQCVCSRWEAVALDDRLWKTFVYSVLENEMDSDIAKTLQRTPKLQTLVFNKTVGCSVIDAIGYCSKLKRLQFVQRLSADTLGKLIHGCQSLEHLTVPASVLHDIERTQLIGHFHNLEKLTLIHKRQERAPILLNVLANGCPALQHLNMMEEAFENDDLEYFMTKKQNQLKSMAVQWCGQRGKCSVPVLAVCKSLNTLIITNYSYIDTDAGFSSLKSMKNVTSLTLTFSHNISGRDLIHLFDNGEMAHLVELKLLHFEIYDNGLATVIVNNCPLLKVLFLNNFYFTENVSLENLHQLKYLQYLSLHCCMRVTYESIVSLWKCKRLKYLNLCRCMIVSQKDLRMMVDLSNTLKTIKRDVCSVKGQSLNPITPERKKPPLHSLYSHRRIVYYTY